MLVHDVTYLLSLRVAGGKEATIIHVSSVEGNTVVREWSVLQAVHEGDGKEAGYAAAHTEATDLFVGLLVECEIGVTENHLEDRRDVTVVHGKLDLTMAAATSAATSRRKSSVPSRN